MWTNRFFGSGVSVILALLIAGHSATESEESGEALLYSKILDGYNVLERPVKNHSSAVHVQLKVELQQIVDIDEKNQIMEMNVWYHFQWFDYRLTWNPEDYDGVTDIRFPPEVIWRPDILLLNSVDPNFGSTHMANILVFHDGKIEWIPPGITKSSCILDITWFPFDDQLCYLKFGSWTYTKDKMTLTSDGTDVSNYMESGEWLLLDYPSEVEELVDDDDSAWQYVYFRYHLRRRTLYFGFNLITPSLLVAVLSVLGFTMPVECSEKITLEITILLSICVFMEAMAEMVPITSESLPLLTLLFFCHMVAVTVSIAFSVMVLNYHYRSPKTHSMSEWTRKILLNWLPWLLLMKRPQHTLVPPPFIVRDVSIPESLRSYHSGSECHYNPQDTDKPSPDSDLNPNLVPRHRHHRRSFDPAMARECLQLEARIEESIHNLGNSNAAAYGTKAVLLSLEQIYHELKFITEFTTRAEEIENVINDWHFASAVVDRLCLVFFSVFIVCATMGVLMSSPHLIA